MKRLLILSGLAALLLSAGCGPLTSIACDNVAYLCADVDVDLAYCDSAMSLAPPYVRAEIVDCTQRAKSCDQAAACFTSRGYYSPVF